MSGFLLVYKNYQVPLSISLKENIFFSLHRVKKLYLLHIITMCFMIPLSSELQNHDGLRPILDLAKKIFLNMALLQTWYPDSSMCVSLNGVSWYLSVALFLWFMFPWIKRFIEYISTVKLYMICALGLILQIVTCIPFIRSVGTGSHKYIWYMYCFPIFRLVDFFTGCVLGKTYLCRKPKDCNRIIETAKEIIVVIISVLVLGHIGKYDSTVLLIAIQNWTTIYILLAALWVYMFAKCGGYITRLISKSRVLMFIGNISGYSFLIHYVITTHTNRLLIRLSVDMNRWERAVLIIVELIVSVGFSVLYKMLRDIRTDLV